MYVSLELVLVSRPNTANWIRLLCGRPGHRSRGRAPHIRKQAWLGADVPASIPWSESACADVRNNRKTEFAKLSSAALRQTREAHQAGMA
jgi:hypothetical protein